MAGYIPRRFTCPWAVTHPSSNRAQCRLTSLLKPIRADHYTTPPPSWLWMWNCELLYRNDTGSSLVWISDRPRLCVLASFSVQRWQRCVPCLWQLGNGHVPAGFGLCMQESFFRILYTCHMPVSVSARSHNHKCRDDTRFHDIRYCDRFWTAATCC